MMIWMTWRTERAGTWHEFAQASRRSRGKRSPSWGNEGWPTMSMSLTAALPSACGIRSQPCRPLSSVWWCSRRCNRGSSPFVGGGVHHPSV
jgi:hypothetical protein